MSHQHIITITVNMTETLAEAQHQQIIDDLDGDVESMLNEFKALHCPDDTVDGPLPYVTTWEYTIDSEDTE